MSQENIEAFVRALDAGNRCDADALLEEILEGRIEPGRVFDRTVDLDGVPDGYRGMADRESINVDEAVRSSGRQFHSELIPYRPVTCE